MLCKTKSSSWAFLAVLGVLVADPPRGESVEFQRGDSNADGSTDISDAVTTLSYLFLAGAEVSCKDAADSNDDGNLNVSDPIHLLGYLFMGGIAPRFPGGQCGDDPTDDSLDCLQYSPCNHGPVTGQSEFATKSQGGPPAVAGDRNTEDGGAGPAVPAGDASSATEPERLIEESDIYKLSGDTLYVLNRYRGLQVVDLSDLTRPSLLGQAPIYGYPREMYVRGERAYVIVSDYYMFWRDPVAVEDVIPRCFYGSQLRIIDISNAREPKVIGGIDIEGDATDSRIVGNVMYIASSRYSWYYRYDSDDSVDKTQVLAVDISDPADVRVVDTKDFPRNGWEDHIHVTPDAMYIASSGYWVDDWRQLESRVRYVDISDPTGWIRVRGEARVAGRIQDRWCMDEHEGALRVASGQSWGNGDVYLTTFSVADPDNISRLGGATLHVDESLTAARFDGPRGYLVSYRNIDPLFVFDLSDPTKPTLTGELEMTGWLDFMIPMGDRIAALGHEDITDPDTGERTISLAVSLVSVALGEKPRLLSRAALDGVWGWVPSERDDFAKVFKAIPELGLILFPFHAWSQEEYRYVGGVQLIDYDRDSLARRGLIEGGGWVERGIPHGETTVLTLSTEILQVVDIQDRDHPVRKGSLQLSRNVQDFALLPGNFTVQLAGDWYSAGSQLLTTSIDDPNAPAPLGEVALPTSYGRLFTNGSMAYVTSVEDVRGNDGLVTGQVTKVRVVDLSDPANPQPRGILELPVPVWAGNSGGPWYWWGGGDEVVQVNGSTLAFHRYLNYWWWDCLGCGGPVALEGDARADDAELPKDEIYVVDLKDPDQPVLASTVVLENVYWAWGLKASGSMLYLSSYRTYLETDSDWWVTQYFLNRVDVTDPARPVVLPEVNVPGMFVDASGDGQYIYTQESTWDEASQRSKTVFYCLALAGEKAHLQSKVELPGYQTGIAVKGSAAFATVSWGDVRVLEDVSEWVNHTALFTIDLSDPQAIQIAGQAEVPFDYATLLSVDAGRAFLSSYAGIFVILVEDLFKPTFEEFFRTQGWASEVVVRGGRAYLPSGYYGVQVFEVGGAPGP